MESTNNYINQADFQAILDFIPQLKIRKWDDSDIKFLYKIMRWCALRPMEAIKLSKEDFNLDDRKLFLGQTKTRKNVTKTIPTFFVEQLRVYLHGKDTGRLFKGLTYHPFYMWCKKIGEEIGIEAWTTPQSETGEKTVGHIGRKSMAKDMIYGEILDVNGKKFEMPIISKHLEHKSIGMTDLYVKASQAQVSQSL